MCELLPSHFIKLPSVELMEHWTLSGFSIPWASQLRDRGRGQRIAVPNVH